MRTFAKEPTLDVWYESLGIEDLVEEMHEGHRKRARKRINKMGRRTNLGSLDKLTEVVDGKRVIRERPHLVERIDPEEWDAELVEAFDSYLASLPTQVRVLTDRYTPVDMAFKVVGVGSVGTRAWIVYLEGQGPGDDPLFLQFKEASRSVLEPFTNRSRFKNQGHRVVTGQHIMQAASDVFLGWTTGGDGTHYYARQLRDWKGSPEPEEWDAKQLTRYAEACGWTLARAHARSLDPALLAGYLGKSDSFPEAVVAFAESYADQNERDHERLLGAIDAGEIEVQKGI
jgi:uncharacterized protein (DUF2252 family)